MTRSKKFTGCWTCRRRGIKCDEQRPSCSNCSLTSFTCEGYKIRLCWENMNDQRKARFDSTRSFVLYKWDENDLLDDLQVDFYLEKIDLASNFLLKEQLNVGLENGYNYGPFHVFNPHSDHTSEKGVAVDQLQQQKEQDHINRERNRSFSSTEDETQLESPAKSQFMNDSDSILSKLEEMNFIGVSDHLHVESLLVKYWNDTLAKLLVPTTDDVYNPYKMLLRLALESRLSDRSSLTENVLHSMCAISASFLSIPGKSFTLDEYYHDVIFEEYWRFHKSKAFEWIARTYSLKESFSFEDLVMIVASIALLFTIDCFHPSDQWQVHLKGSLSIYKSVIERFENFHQLLFNDDQNKTLFELMIFFGKMTKMSYISGCLADFYTQLSITDFDFLNFPYESNSTSLVFQNHGINQETFNCLTDIVRYLQSQKLHPTNNTISMTSLEDASNASDMALSKIAKQLEICASIPMEVSEDIDSKIRYDQAKVFYISVRLYFLREALNVPPTTLQSLVNLGVDHIEHCQRLLDQFNTTALFWPYFVIFCECTTVMCQERITKWFKTMENHSITNVDQSFQIIKVLWERRKLQPSLSWVTVKEEINPSLLLN